MASRYNIGNATLRIVPDLTGFAAKLETDLKAILNALGQQEVKVTADVEDSLARKKMDEFRAREKANKVNVEADVDTAKASVELDVFRNAQGRDINIDVDVDFSSAESRLEQFRRVMESRMRSTGRALENYMGARSTEVSPRAGDDLDSRTGRDVVVRKRVDVDVWEAETIMAAFRVMEERDPIRLTAKVDIDQQSLYAAREQARLAGRANQRALGWDVIDAEVVEGFQEPGTRQLGPSPRQNWRRPGTIGLPTGESDREPAGGGDGGDDEPPRRRNRRNMRDWWSDREPPEALQNLRVVQNMSGINLFNLSNIAAAGAAIGGLVALVGGLVAAAAAAGTALGAVGATAAVGMTGVIKAFSEMRKSSQSAGKDGEDAAKRQRDALDRVADATQGVQTAQDNYGDSQRKIREAQERLNDSWRDGTRELRDLNMQVTEAGQSQEYAAIAVARARERQQEVLNKRARGKASDLDVQEANLDVRSAQTRLQGAQNDLSDTKTDAREANRKGVSGSDVVMGAKNDLRDAQRAQADSAIALARAQRELARAQEDATAAQRDASTSQDKYQEALKNLSPNAREFVLKIRELGGEWKSLRNAVQDKMFAGLGNDFQSFARDHLPALKTGMVELAGLINGLLKDAMLTIGNTFREFTADGTFKSFIGSVKESFKGFVPVLDAMVRALTHMTIAMGPALGDMFKALAKYINDTTPFFSRLGKATIDALTAIFPILTKLFAAFEPAIQILLPVLVSLFSQFADIAMANQGNLSQLATLIGTYLSHGLEVLGDVLGMVMPLLAGFIWALTQVPPGFLAFLITSAIVMRTFLVPLVGLSNFVGRIGAAGQGLKVVFAVLAMAGRGLATAILFTAFALNKMWIALKASTAATIAKTIADKLATAATKVWAGVQLVFNAIMALNPITLVIIAIAAIIAAIVICAIKFQGFRDVLKDVWDAIMKAFRAAWDWIKSVFVNGWNAVWDGLVSRYNTVKDGILSVIDKIKSVMSSLKDVAGSVAQGIKNAFSGVVDVLKAPIHFIGKLLQLIPTKIGPISIPFAGKLNTWGGLLQKLRDGGVVEQRAGRTANNMLYGPGTGTSDSILGVDEYGVPTARVSRGESVVNEEATRKHWPVVHALNTGNLDRMFPGLPGWADGTKFDERAFNAAWSGFFSKWAGGNTVDTRDAYLNSHPNVNRLYRTGQQPPDDNSMKFNNSWDQYFRRVINGGNNYTGEQREKYLNSHSDINAMYRSGKLAPSYQDDVKAGDDWMKKRDHFNASWARFFNSKMLDGNRAENRDMFLSRNPDINQRYRSGMLPPGMDDGFRLPPTSRGGNVEPTMDAGGAGGGDMDEAAALKALGINTPTDPSGGGYQFTPGNTDDYAASAGGSLPPLGSKGSEAHLQVDSVRVARAVAAKFPQIQTIGGYRPSDPYPDHPSGRAVDVMIPNYGSAEGKALGKQVADYVMQNKAAFNVEYIIWDQTYTPASGTGNVMEDRGSDTQNHKDHVHITTKGGGTPNGTEQYTAPGGDMAIPGQTMNGDVSFGGASQYDPSAISNTSNGTYDPSEDEDLADKLSIPKAWGKANEIAAEGFLDFFGLKNSLLGGENNVYMKAFIDAQKEEKKRQDRLKPNTSNVGSGDPNSPQTKKLLQGNESPDKYLNDGSPSPQSQNSTTNNNAALTGGVTASPGGGIKDQVAAAFNPYGWGNGPQWAATDWIVGKESGWNPTAVNPSSGAFGLFQFLGPTKDQYLPDKNPDPFVQGKAGSKYIKDRYGDPLAAKAFWEQHNWYDSGGWLEPGATLALNGTGKPEAIFTNEQWGKIDTVVTGMIGGYEKAQSSSTRGLSSLSRSDAELVAAASRQSVSAPDQGAYAGRNGENVSIDMSTTIDSVHTRSDRDFMDHLDLRDNQRALARINRPMR